MKRADKRIAEIALALSIIDKFQTWRHNIKAYGSLYYKLIILVYPYNPVDRRFTVKYINSIGHSDDIEGAIEQGFHNYAQTFAHVSFPHRNKGPIQIIVHLNTRLDSCQIITAFSLLRKWCQHQW